MSSLNRCLTNKSHDSRVTSLGLKGITCDLNILFLAIESKSKFCLHSISTNIYVAFPSIYLHTFSHIASLPIKKPIDF